MLHRTSFDYPISIVKGEIANAADQDKEDLVAVFQVLYEVLRELQREVDED